MVGAYVVIATRLARTHAASLRPEPGGLRGTARSGGWLFLRTLSLRAAFLATVAVATGLGSAELAGWQIAFTIFSTAAFALDALAIAAQALVGKSLGAGDVAGARHVLSRTVSWGLWFGVAVGALVAAASGVLGLVFTGDPAIAALIQPALLVLAVAQPLASFVFVLDGVLIGAGDARYLAIAGLLNLVPYVPARARGRVRRRRTGGSGLARRGVLRGLHAGPRRDPGTPCPRQGVDDRGRLRCPRDSQEPRVPCRHEVEPPGPRGPPRSAVPGADPARGVHVERRGIARFLGVVPGSPAPSLTPSAPSPGEALPSDAAALEEWAATALPENGLGGSTAIARGTGEVGSGGAGVDLQPVGGSWDVVVACESATGAPLTVQIGGPDGESAEVSCGLPGGPVRHRRPPMGCHHLGHPADRLHGAGRVRLRSAFARRCVILPNFTRPTPEIPILGSCGGMWRRR